MNRTSLRFTALLLALTLLAGTALADLDIIYKGNDTAIYGAVDETGGYIVNVVPPTMTVSESVQYSLTPLDVVIVIDTSGSMSASSTEGRTLLSFSTAAAEKFVKVLMAVNPSSRVGLVSYDTTAHDVLTLTGLNEEEKIFTAINSLHFGGSTNQTDGFRHATAMLGSRRAGAQGMVLLLTDGEYNEGGSPRAAGYEAAANGLVYTVGLVGGMSASQKAHVREALNCGYEKRYFEVDFSSMDDSSIEELEVCFLAAAMAASCSGLDGNISYSQAYASYILRVDGSMDVRVVAEDSPGYISSAVDDFSDMADFGSLSVTGKGMDEKTVVLKPGHYGITLRGTDSRKGRYSLKSIAGASVKETEIISETVDVHPALIMYFDTREGKAARTDLSWDPLDHTAVDPFTGTPTRGSQAAAAGRLTDAVTPAAWVSKAANTGDSLKKNAYVHVLARDPETGLLLISYVGGKGKLARGWVKPGAVRVNGYVPDLIRDEPAAYTIPAGVTAYRAPSAEAAEAMTVKKDTPATLIHAEYDMAGTEWAYLLPDANSGRAAVYVPAAQIPGWRSVCPEDFRIGYETPVFVWENRLGGNGFTEVMWVAPRWEGSGVAVSGRTTSTSGDLRARNGNRDAMALLYAPDGTVEKSVTTGGSEIDSFHCIVPWEDGFFVSGVTRSNDKEFKDIWDAATYSGKISGKSKSSNALLGCLDRDLGVRWMKSFGGGSTTDGFDMVMRMPDGSAVGYGWLTSGKDFAVQSAGNQDFFAAHVHEDGRLIGLHRYGTAANDISDAASPTAEGGLIMVGSVGSGKGTLGQIIFADANFDQTGVITQGGGGQDVFDNVRDLGDSTYLVTGFTSSYGHGGRDFWALRVDSQGRILWQKTYGGSGNEELRGTVILSNGTAVLLGDTLSSDGDVLGTTGKGKNAWAICIDFNGRMLWQYTACVSGDNWFNSAAEDPADGCLVLGGVCAYSSDKKANGYVVKLRMPAVTGAVEETR